MFEAVTSEVFSAELSPTSPRKLFIVNIQKIHFLHESIHQNNNLTLKKVSLLVTRYPSVKYCVCLQRTNILDGGGSRLAEIPVRSPRRLLIFIIYKNTLWIKVSKKDFISF